MDLLVAVFAKLLPDIDVIRGIVYPYVLKLPVTIHVLLTRKIVNETKSVLLALPLGALPPNQLIACADPLI